NCRRVDIDVDAPAVLGAMDALTAHGAGLQLRLQPALKAGSELRIVDVARVQAQQLFARVTEATRRGRVGLEDIALLIVNEDSVVDGFEQDSSPGAGRHRSASPQKCLKRGQDPFTRTHIPLSIKGPVPFSDNGWSAQIATVCLNMIL